MHILKTIKFLKPRRTFSVTTALRIKAALMPTTLHTTTHWTQTSSDSSQHPIPWHLTPANSTHNIMYAQTTHLISRDIFQTSAQSQGSRMPRARQVINTTPATDQPHDHTTPPKAVRQCSKHCPFPHPTTISNQPSPAVFFGDVSRSDTMCFCTETSSRQRC